MSVFNRIAGTEEPKIAVWPIICDFTRMMDNELSLAQLAELYSFSQAEITECTEYLQALSAMIASRTAALVVVGLSQPLAEEYARTRIGDLVTHFLLRTEHRTITEAQFRNKLGLI